MTQCTWKTPPSTEPIEIPDRDGLVISTSGTLGRAADRLRHTRDCDYLAQSLTLLEDHIGQLRANPTAANLGEFLSLWVP